MISTSLPTTYVSDKKLCVTFTSKSGSIPILSFIHICRKTWRVKSHVRRQELLLWHLERLCYVQLRCQP